jgi:hypothetical protein
LWPVNGQGRGNKWPLGQGEREGNFPLDNPPSKKYILVKSSPGGIHDGPAQYLSVIETGKRGRFVTDNGMYSAIFLLTGIRDFDTLKSLMFLS